MLSSLRLGKWLTLLQPFRHKPTLYNLLTFYRGVTLGNPHFREFECVLPTFNDKKERERGLVCGMFYSFPDFGLSVQECGVTVPTWSSSPVIPLPPLTPTLQPPRPPPRLPTIWKTFPEAGEIYPWGVKDEGGGGGSGLEGGRKRRGGWRGERRERTRVKGDGGGGGGVGRRKGEETGRRREVGRQERVV